MLCTQMYTTVHFYSVQLRFLLLKALRLRDDIYHRKIRTIFFHTVEATMPFWSWKNQTKERVMMKRYRLKKIVFLATLSNESFAKLTVLPGPTKKYVSSCNLF